MQWSGFSTIADIEFSAVACSYQLSFSVGLDMILLPSGIPRPKRDCSSSEPGGVQMGTRRKQRAPHLSVFRWRRGWGGELWMRLWLTTKHVAVHTRGFPSHSRKFINELPHQVQ